MSNINPIFKMTTAIPSVSKLAFRTCFSSISFNGYKLDILKSAVQKYLRRREFDKMVWCVAEIYLFQVYAKTDVEKRATKGIISNLINRLIIMLDEEMLFAECEKYLLVRRYMEEFEKSGRGNFGCLFKICDVMCGARMIRRNSDIRGYWSPGKKNVKVDNGDGSDDYYFMKFKEKFENSDPECFLWMLKIFYKGEESDIVRYRRKENIYMIWEYLFDRKNIKNNEVLRKVLEYKLKEFYKKNRSERFIFLSSAIDIAMYKGKNDKKDWFDCKKKKKFNVEDLVKEHGTKFENRELIQEVYLNWKKLEIDDYAIDMHTSAGRKMGKNKIDFIASGAVVVDEDKEYFVKEWRDCYNKAKKASFAAAVALRQKKDDAKLKKEKKKQAKTEKKLVKKKESENEKIEPEKKKGKKTEREKIRAAKYKRIKKLRGKPNFNDLEKDLEFIDGENIAVNYIKLCSDKTCENKVMCFEFVTASWGKPNTVWKESRKSMNYNRDYACIDECKELFGLKKIGMKRVLSNFRVEKIDKNEKSWINNWKKVYTGDEKVVYCVMNKISHCNWDVPMEIGNIKHSFQNGECRRHLKEFAKIGVFRGIFRCSDFNCRNVLVGCDKSYMQDYFVSIDEGDIGKRLDMIGKREGWLIKALNKDKTIINEILDELVFDLEYKVVQVLKKMTEYKFSHDLCNEVLNNLNNLRADLEAEGVLFD